VEKIYPSDANFVLVRFRDAGEITRLALENNIVLRDQSHQCGLDNCIRITIGAQHEMEKLLGILRGESIESPVNIRTAKASRVTCETAIDVRVNLDESAPVKIDSGVAFFDHMLEQVARHGGFSLELNCKGDLEVDAHHTIEDCGIALGQALREALGSKEGLGRYGFVMPMDESLAQIAIDLSGRFYLGFEGEFPDRQAGDMPAEMIEHFFYSLCENLPATCHISVKGENTHHMAEACFKGFGRAMRQAVRREGEELPSTKGVL
jgi:imidazoleglycerol phosphate dehydratase HisB